MASSIDNIISMFQQRAMHNAYKKVGARNIGGKNFHDVLNKKTPDNVKSKWSNNYSDIYSKSLSDLNRSYKSGAIGGNAVNNKYLKMQSVLSVPNISDINTYDKFTHNDSDNKAFLNTISSANDSINAVNPAHMKPIHEVEDIFCTKSIGEEISSGISNQINNIKSSEAKINHLSEVEDIDSMEFVTNVHNLELQVKQFNIVMNKIVDVLKSLLYNTQI